MRVLHVLPSVSKARGGPSAALELMEHHLSAAGVGVTTLTTDDDGPGCRLTISVKPTKANGARRVYLRKWIEFYTVAPAMLPWLQRNLLDFDVVHIHALFSFSSVIAALMARQKGVPYIVRPLGTLTYYGLMQRRPLAKHLSLALFERRILRHAAAVHFTSELEFEEAKALGIPLRGVVIPLGVDALRAPSLEFLHEYPNLRDRTVLLYLSRIDPKKNIEGLLRAFAILRPTQRKLALLVAGSGDPTYVASLQSLTYELNVADEVIWLGQVDDLIKAAVLATADIFVLPSFSENFGMAAAEALLAGLPCVLGRGVAIAAEVEVSGAGLTVDPNPEAIACAVNQLVSHESLRHKMGEAGRKFARESYSTAAMTERLIDLYQMVTCDARHRQSSDITRN